MLLGTLGAGLLGNLLSGKWIVRPSSGNKKGKGIVRAGYGNKIKIIMKMNKNLMEFFQEIIFLKK